MKKIKARILIGLVIINVVSSGLAWLISWPLGPLLFKDSDPGMVDVFRFAIQVTLSLIIFAVFVFVGVKELAAPLGVISDAVQKIATGDFDVELPALTRKDEIGALMNNFGVMAEELKNNECIQRDFISNVSHEFKTPLAVIAGYAKILSQSTQLDETGMQCGAAIVDEAERLSKMTANILLLSKLNNQSIQPKFAPFSLDEQLRQAVLSHEPFWKAKKLRLDVKTEPIVITANEELLLNVWSNLISNAIKYTRESGYVFVEAGCFDNCVKVVVADSGVGMDEDTQKRIFDQFYQGDASRTEQGNGLGLAIVERIVKLHRGEVEVASAPNEGSVFTVLIPLESALEAVVNS